MKRYNSGSKFSEAIVDIIVKHAAKNFGFYARLADEMTRLSKTSNTKKADQRVWSRAHVACFFSPDKEKRHEPAWGTGILIQKAFDNLTKRNGA